MPVSGGEMGYDGVSPHFCFTVCKKALRDNLGQIPSIDTCGTEVELSPVGGGSLRP